MTAAVYLLLIANRPVDGHRTIGRVGGIGGQRSEPRGQLVQPAQFDVDVAVLMRLDDFGVQGASPSHPELLDHLASVLVDRGWDVRALIREIVRSDAYAQASRDGAYELYEHQPRYRFDAELVRDNALSVSGLLVREVGGPSVRPYQPKGYWAHLNFPRRTYAASSGADLYRRTLYQHWQRQYLHPSLLAFDAPSRERCTAERARSNTPQAALALLNDPIYVEAARVLAARVLDEAEEHDAARLTRAWRLVLQRAPRASELVVAAQLLTDHREHYAAHRDEAGRLVEVGDWPPASQYDVAELAAWTSVARLLLNLHETITRS